eukprot:TRINITY_DN4215_c0_g1_i1.p1 TRINITY_DN4215_c0_g1~~TRINITY_DN4215_c0_g1_i1.p1  ORF type:complete len:318 (-),score=73.41 TRINITY_DN4215_c0_g1_i1:39-953(-)
MTQNKRNSVYEQFTKAESGVLLATDLIARGVDIPDVDCILQYDPPQDPSFYIHRVGRTARNGAQGQAHVYLLQCEDTYVEFLQVKKVPAVEEKALAMENPAGILQEIKQMALQDRDVMEKAQKAFVSFIRAYKEHHCNYIFSLQNLDYARIARGMALLYFPSMAELRGKKVEYEAVDVHPGDIPYKDKQREKQRQANMASHAAKIEALKQRREQLKAEKEKALLEKGPKRRNKRNLEMWQEWEELQREERLARKLASGKITLEDYEIETGERSRDSKKFKTSGSKKTDESNDSDEEDGSEEEKE